MTTWLRQWLTNQEDVRELRDGTITDYRRHIQNYWIPRIGALRLADLRPQHVTNALRQTKKERDKEIRQAEELKARYGAEAAAADEERKRAGRKRPVKPKKVIVPRPFGPVTARLVHATLRAALNAAMRAQEAPRNVAVLAELPRHSRRRVKPWTPDRLGAWLDAIAGERLYPLCHLAAFAGLRWGELCGLGWDDVDLDAGHVTVRWQITGISYRKAKAAAKHGRKLPYRVHPKTSDGEDRVVDLDAATIRELRRSHARQATERLALGPVYRNDENLVFTRPDGTPLDPTSSTRPSSAWSPARDARRSPPPPTPRIGIAANRGGRGHRGRLQTARPFQDQPDQRHVQTPHREGGEGGRRRRTTGGRQVAVDPA